MKATWDVLLLILFSFLMDHRVLCMIYLMKITTPLKTVEITADGKVQPFQVEKVTKYYCDIDDVVE